MMLIVGKPKRTGGKMGIRIIDVKVVGLCSKCRNPEDEVMKDVLGEIYSDKRISCVGCALGKPSQKTGVKNGN